MIKIKEYGHMVRKKNGLLKRKEKRNYVDNKKEKKT